MSALGVRIRDPDLTLSAMGGLVALAERSGYDSVWLPESIAPFPIDEPIAETFERTIAGCAPAAV